MNFFFRSFKLMIERIFLMLIKIFDLSMFLIEETLSIEKFKERYLIKTFLFVMKC